MIRNHKWGLIFELAAWSAGLLLVSMVHPAHAHYTVCPLALAGLDWCPGCGLGHAVGWLVRGHFVEAFQSHPLVPVAVLVLLYRIKQLILRLLNKKHHERELDFHAA